MSDFNYEEEKIRMKAKLDSGAFDIEVLPNTGTKELGANDVAAFEKHLKSDESKRLTAWVLRK